MLGYKWLLLKVALKNGINHKNKIEQKYLQKTASQKNVWGAKVYLNLHFF
jgi:hypothetical protein